MEKCGEIFLLNNAKFIFICAFCNKEFNEMLNFGKHIREEHEKLHNENEINDFKNFRRESPNLLDYKAEIKFSEEEEGINNEFHIGCDPDFIPSKIENKQIEIDVDSDEDNIIQIYHRRHPEADLATPPGRGGYHGPNEKHESENPLTDSDNEQSSKSSSPVDKVEQQKLDDFKCKYCFREFEDQVSRVRHERTHTGEKPFQCLHCPKLFSRILNRNDHIFTHTGERPYKCTHCPSAFKHKMNLTVHIRAHLGEKRFACDLCNKRFIRNIERKIHRRSHTGEKPYQCEECGASFSTSGKLTEHRKRHKDTKNHKCEICDKAFYSKRDLKSHLVVHSDARPFQCEICFVTFPRKKALQSHVKIHSNVKEYICTICGKGFAQNAGRYSHMKTHGIKLGQKKDEVF